MMMIDHWKRTMLYLGFLLFVSTFLKLNNKSSLEVLIRLSEKILIMKAINWNHMNSLAILFPFLRYKKFFYLIFLPWK